MLNVRKNFPLSDYISICILHAICSHSYSLCVSLAVMRKMCVYCRPNKIKMDFGTPYRCSFRCYNEHEHFIPLEYEKYARFSKKIYARALRLNQNENFRSLPAPALPNSITWIFDVRFELIVCLICGNRNLTKISLLFHLRSKKIGFLWIHPCHYHYLYQFRCVCEADEEHILWFFFVIYVCTCNKCEKFA